MEFLKSVSSILDGSDGGSSTEPAKPAEIVIPPGMNSEAQRLRTFESMPKRGMPSAGSLARAGFFLAPDANRPDRCLCFSCAKVFFDWEPDDDPWCVACPRAPVPASFPRTSRTQRATRTRACNAWSRGLHSLRRLFSRRVAATHGLAAQASAQDFLPALSLRDWKGRHECSDPRDRRSVLGNPLPAHTHTRARKHTRNRRRGPTARSRSRVEWRAD